MRKVERISFDLKSVRTPAPNFSSEFHEEFWITGQTFLTGIKEKKQWTIKTFEITSAPRHPIEILPRSIHFFQRITDLPRLSYRLKISFVGETFVRSFIRCFHRSIKHVAFSSDGSPYLYPKSKVLLSEWNVKLCLIVCKDFDCSNLYPFFFFFKSIWLKNFELLCSLLTPS